MTTGSTKDVRVNGNDGKRGDHSDPNHGVVTPRPAGGGSPLRDIADSGVLEVREERNICTRTLHVTCAAAKSSDHD